MDIAASQHQWKIEFENVVINCATFGGNFNHFDALR